MPHKRDEIREAVKTAIIRGEDLGIPIHSNRLTPIMEAELPVIVIRTPKETSQLFAQAPRILDRRLELVVEVLVKGDGTDVSVDEIAQKVEGAINRSRFLDGLSSQHTLVESELAIATDGDTPIGSLKLKYEVRYLTDETPVKDVSNLEGTNVHFVQ